MNFNFRIAVFLPLAIFALVALAFLIVWLRDQSGQPQIADDGIKSAPVFQLSSLRGSAIELFSSDDLKKGKVFFVNVWASWCAPCRAEHPFLMELTGRKDIIVAGIAYKDAPEDSRRFLKRFGNPYDRLGLDETGRAALGWGIYGVPESFIINGAGRIIFHHRGPITDLAPVQQAIDRALTEFPQ